MKVRRWHLAPRSTRSVDAGASKPSTSEVAGRSWSTYWGRWDALGTPAFWVDQTHRLGFVGSVSTNRPSLEAELVFCLLGGFGVTAEAARDAHDTIRTYLSAHHEVSADAIEALLREPSTRTGRRYRFPQQRARRIAEALHTVRSGPRGTQRPDF